MPKYYKTKECINQNQTVHKTIHLNYKNIKANPMT